MQRPTERDSVVFWLGFLAAWFMILFVFSEAGVASERLELELVPVYVTDPVAQRAPGDAELSAVLSRTHEAMALLGVPADAYNVVLSDHAEYLDCSPATVLVEQLCHHATLGPIADWTAFAKTLYPVPRPREYRLLVLMLPERWAWMGVAGYTWWWRWTNDPNALHWTNVACRAWSIDDLVHIAHEIGHCLMLVHNQEDTDRDIDVMLAVPGRVDWIKPSNAERVLHQLRENPEPANTLVRPVEAFAF